LPTWQHSSEGQVCAWPGYSALLPNQNNLEVSFILHVIRLYNVAIMQTGGSQVAKVTSHPQIWTLDPGIARHTTG